ncbi:MAG: hypothetical protein K2X10_06850 [Hyphomicrobiales bacterium]|nr:hypothetical protein [Hyphomicrobiales bacterium]
MMNTIEALRENEQVSDYYRAAFSKWRELLKAFEKSSLVDFATAISDAQLDYFEKQCGGRSMGQEIMAWTGIAYYYDAEEAGFGDDLDKARKIYDAMQLSHISIEAKINAEKAAISYDLFEDLEEAEGEAG